MHAVGDDSGRRAGERDRLAPERFTAIAVSALALCSPVASSASISRSLAESIFTRQFDQVIGHAGHRRDDCDHIVPGSFRREQTLRHLSDAIGISDRSAAVFLDDQTHDEARPVFSFCCGVNLGRAAIARQNAPISVRRDRARRGAPIRGGRRSRGLSVVTGVGADDAAAFVEWESPWRPGFR